MKYPNLRYGNPNEFRHYAQGVPLKALAKHLRRSERCVKDWLLERQKIPYWVPELLRLQNMEHYEMMRQMNIQTTPKRLGTVTTTGIIYQMPTRQTEQADTPDDALQDDSQQQLFA